jgi:hypothetical protein
LLQTVGAFDLSGIRQRTGLEWGAPVTPSQESAPKVPTSTTTPLEHAIRTGKPEEVQQALALRPLTSDQVDKAIELLAWNEVAPHAIRALSEAAGSHSDVLLSHLLAPDEDFAIRRRLVNALAACRSVEVFDGLMDALNDQRFEVRYRVGRALSGMADEIVGLHVNRERVLQAVQREIAVDRGIWETRQLIDNPDDVASPMETELLRDRASRSLEHLFTLLSLILPRQTLRLAFHALHTDDPQLRGTALEYLETTLPEPLWRRLRLLLPTGASAVKPGATPDRAARELLASRETIGLALAEARRRSSKAVSNS